MRDRKLAQPLMRLTFHEIAGTSLGLCRLPGRMQVVGQLHRTACS